ncbi:hypothetical protein TBR22_A31920 [Luteitalea sp. TBR-22]|uniref:hypothetical protein n=1 Tax=Luteitalea sp. TBR-22 TaxID=2802971 RepID=UPI001AF19019|nr:hypothetical protein [Luteitalea sp. TBR-22]BCS33964.1 hypothetical protein TBR22_A31920 [Luteitalea sp. TBR-22]
MNLEPRLLVSWIRDVLIAYAGGLVLGAPLALLGVWVTGRESTATVSLLTAMGVLLVGLRRRRSSLPTAPVVVRPVAQRRVA